MKRPVSLLLTGFLVLSTCILVTAGCVTQEEEPATVSGAAVEDVPVAEHENPKPPLEQEEPPVVEQEAPEEKPFEVTEEIFSRTFTDIETLIDELNVTISNKNFDRWLSYLTPEYKEHYSDPEVLQEISKSPTLQKYNIRLTSLRDFFKYVVVPSRSNARLDDLVFTTDDTVKAIMIVDGQRVILYSLEKSEENWKIGV